MKKILNGLKFMFYIYSHPFDGFWIMKSEQKGNMQTALVLFALMVATTVIRIVAPGYLFESATLNQFSPWALATVLAVLLVLYCVCNWALTTLVGGSANMKYIFIAAMYALTPIMILNVPITLLCNVFVLKEAEFITLFTTFSFIWALFLLLVANSVIHEFTMFKSIITFIVTLFGMVFVIIIGLFFVYIVQQFFVWMSQIISEISYRL